MEARRVVAVVILCAGILASRGSIALAQSDATAPAAAPSILATTTGPPSDGENAFSDGYRAYKNHDDARAIERLRFASENFPVLADYALYFMALAQRESGDMAGAADTLARLVQSYPQSVNADAGQLMQAQLLLKLGRSGEAASSAARVVARTNDPMLEQQARVAEAQAMVALGNFKDAYKQLMELRDLYPRSDADAQARAMVRSILGSHPEVAETGTLTYYRSEAELLLREGALSDAAAQADAALDLEPPAPIRAELTWVKARALKPNPESAKRALLDYLHLAPQGPSAPAALEALALIYWHDDQYAAARTMFGQLTAKFPGSQLAPGAMLRIGRIFEDEKKLDAARAQYRRLASRYPNSDAAGDARFRGPWTLYQSRQYRGAAAGFADARAHLKQGSDRDMCDYWRARALEKIHDEQAARAIFLQLAQSTDSNYYPALAALRVSAGIVDLPASYADEPSFAGTPTVAGTAEFHMARLEAMRRLRLTELEPGELKAIEEAAAASNEMRRFVLAGYASAGAWYKAIVAATRMEKRGLVSHAVAERVRYPRAYWDMFQTAALQRALDPYLVLALARQESLFNPKATSVSNARGLMQLIPSTARKMAAERGMDVDSIALYEPSVNVELGTTYLRNLFEMFHGNQFRAVAAYNAGENAVAKWTAGFSGDDDEWVENIGYKETREYVKKVIGGRREYELLYRTDAASAAAAPTPLATQQSPASTSASDSSTSP